MHSHRRCHTSAPICTPLSPNSPFQTHPWSVGTRTRLRRASTPFPPTTDHVDEGQSWVAAPDTNDLLHRTRSRIERGNDGTTSGLSKKKNTSTHFQRDFDRLNLFPSFADLLFSSVMERRPRLLPPCALLCDLQRYGVLQTKIDGAHDQARSPDHSFTAKYPSSSPIPSPPALLAFSSVFSVLSMRASGGT